jgi:hypothetical protein
MDTYDMYDEALDSVTLKVWIVCEQCAAPYAHPRSERQGTGTILKHNYYYYYCSLSSHLDMAFDEQLPI